MFKSPLLPFLLDRLVSSFADQILLYIVPIIVFKQTGSLKMSGIAFTIEWLPRLVSLPLSGAIADRFDKRLVFFISDLSRALCCLFAFWVALENWSFSFLLIVFLSGAVGFFHEMSFVALEGTIPFFLKTGDLPKAQSILQGIDQTAQTFGPGLAACLSMFLPLQVLFLIFAILFSFSALNVHFMIFLESEDKTPMNKIGKLGKAMAIGIRLVATTPALRCLVFLTILVNLIVGIALSASAGHIQLQFGRPESDFGIMSSVAGGCGVVSFFIMPWIFRHVRLEVVGLLGFSTVYICGIVMGIANNFSVYALGFVGMMISVGFVNVFTRTVRVWFIPKDRLSTTIGVIVLLNFTALPIAGLFVSALSITPGISALFTGTGVVSMIISIILFIRLKVYMGQTENR
jgi:MFS family permease